MQIAEFLNIYVNPAFTWEELRELCGWTDLPVMVKGVTNPEDAKMVQQLGMAGAIVSNHGGRQVDGGVATLDALEAVR